MPFTTLWIDWGEHVRDPLSVSHSRSLYFVHFVYLETRFMEGLALVQERRFKFEFLNLDLDWCPLAGLGIFWQDACIADCGVTRFSPKLCNNICFFNPPKKKRK